MTPLIPVDWIKECDIEIEDQIIPKSASQGSELIVNNFVTEADIYYPESISYLTWSEKGPCYQRLNSDTTAIVMHNDGIVL